MKPLFLPKIVYFPCVFILSFKGTGGREYAATESRRSIRRNSRFAYARSVHRQSGYFHDPQTKTLTRKRWASKAWLVCSCSYKSVRRDVMATRSWTELFFFDEATALAAGHRPCFLCRREDAGHFRTAWATGNAKALPSARDIDSVLHKERLQSRHKRLNMLLSPLNELPDGTMIAAGGDAFLVLKGKPYRWGAKGYEHAQTLPFVDGLLTPPSTLRTLGAGYRPMLHPSVKTLSELIAV